MTEQLTLICTIASLSIHLLMDILIGKYYSCFVHTDKVNVATIIGEGNGNPLQCSCLENPRDGGAWWAAVYGVAQSRTRLG